LQVLDGLLREVDLNPTNPSSPSKWPSARTDLWLCVHFQLDNKATLDNPPEDALWDDAKLKPSPATEPRVHSGTRRALQAVTPNVNIDLGGFGSALERIFDKAGITPKTPTRKRRRDTLCRTGGKAAEHGKAGGRQFELFGQYTEE
jgi:hypothetical protein